MLKKQRSIPGTVYPYIILNDGTVKKLEGYTRRIVKKLKVKGLVNIQYVFDGKDIYVIEVNSRASGVKIPVEGSIYISLRDADKHECLETIESYAGLGFKLFASYGTGLFLKENGINYEIIDKYNIAYMIAESMIDMLINVPSKGNNPSSLGFMIRRKASEYRVLVFTSIYTARAFLKAIGVKRSNMQVVYKSLSHYIY